MPITRKSFITFFCLALISPVSYAAEVGPPTPEGWLPHFESLIALAVVLVAFATAFLLNHASPKLRAFGTALAALSCFGIVVWFGNVVSSGILADPKPFQAPMDAWKPTLLWFQASIALIGGIVLLVVAARQFTIGTQLELSNANEETRYGRVSRFLHWATALLFIFMIPTGIFASMIPEDAWYRTEYNVVHKTIGLIIFGLVIARLVWNHRS